MCLVFRARREGEKQDIALKVLREDKRQDERVRDLFITEADLAMLLTHPNLIETYDAGEVDGRYYIAMELMEGGTLGQLLEQFRNRKVPFSRDLALFVLNQLLLGLHALHEAKGRSGRPLGLIHRDVTPHNLFLSFSGRAILGDYGVALIQAYGNMAPGEVLGKLGYLALEAIVMDEVDRRADIFAAGVILYEILTGTTLFSGDDEDEVMARIADVKLIRPRRLQENIPRELEAIIMQALAKKPRDRFTTAAEMAKALRPMWTRRLANEYSLASILAATYPEEAGNWRARSVHLKKTTDLTND